MIPPLAAEPILYVGQFPVTNAMINALAVSVGFIILAVILFLKKSEVPRGLQNVAESILELLLSFGDQVTGDRARTEKLLPIGATIFLFVLANNWLGLLPGTGSIGVWQVHHGEVELIPLLRPAGSDLNLTLAIAVLTVFVTHVLGIATIGFFKHFGKFINIMGIVRSFAKGPMAVIVALIEFAVGLIELVGEVAKTLSLSLRLFGNVFAGEVLLTVIAGLFAFVLPVPFYGLELLVGVIQASVFAILFMAFSTVAMMDMHGDDHDKEHDKQVEGKAPHASNGPDPALAHG